MIMNLKEMLKTNKTTITNESILSQIKEFYMLIKDIKTVEQIKSFSNNSKCKYGEIEINCHINVEYDSDTLKNLLDSEIEVTRYDNYKNLWYMYVFNDKIIFDIEDNEAEETLFESVIITIKELESL